MTWPETIPQAIGYFSHLYRTELNEMAREFGDAAIVWTGGPNYAIAGATPWGLAMIVNAWLSEAGYLGEFGESGMGWGGILEIDPPPYQDVDGKTVQDASFFDYRTAVEHDDFEQCLQLLQDQLTNYSPEGARNEP